jgi:hypothetical protein
MTALADSNNVYAIATYVDRPLSVSPQGSSEVCRWPVALPVLDVNQVMSNIPAFENKHKNNIKDKILRRLMASLKFRLGFKISNNPIGILHFPESNKAGKAFLQDFSEAMKINNTRKALLACNMVCKVVLPTLDKDFSSDYNAADLLLGIEDTDKILSERQIPNVVVLHNGKLSVNLNQLLKLFDPKAKCYNQGRLLFAKALTTTEEADLLANTPLERAYLWSLSCQSAVTGRIAFLESGQLYNFRCEGIASERLFPNMDNQDYDLSCLKNNVLYYAEEKINGKPSHPLADLFFRSDDGEIVLIDIGGGNNENIAEKVKMHIDWIAREQPMSKNVQIKFQSVVIAPNAVGNSKYNETNGVMVVYGNDAVDLLGGLSQIRRWIL